MAGKYHGKTISSKFINICNLPFPLNYFYAAIDCNDTPHINHHLRTFQCEKIIYEKFKSDQSVVLKKTWKTFTKGSRGQRSTKSHAEVCKAYSKGNKPELQQKAVARFQQNRDNATPEQAVKERIRSQQCRDAKKEA